MSRTVEIRYHRPPDRSDLYRQRLIVDRPDCKITLLEPYTDPPLRIGRRVVLESGAPILWFTFPETWHDIGRFYLRDETFTGYYTNIIAPPVLGDETWEIWDLFLDLWIDRDGRITVLDRDEFDEAVDRGWIDRGTAERARRELARVASLAAADRWPPVVVREVDLTRARQMQGR